MKKRLLLLKDSCTTLISVILNLFQDPELLMNPNRSRNKFGTTGGVKAGRSGGRAGVLLNNSIFNSIFFAMIMIIVSAGALSAQALENKHNAMNCGDCHATDVKFGETLGAVELVKNDVIELCIECHKDILFAHHPQRVQVSGQKPEYLPVGEGDSINCVTCHNIHSKDASMHLLRSLDIGNYTSRIDICYECHKEDFKKISPHRSEEEGLSCLVCHRDAPSIKDTRETVTLVNKNVEKICNFCHNIDIDNHPLNVDKSVKLPDSLPRSEKNAVVCITCHDPHGTINSINFLREDYIVSLEFGKYENPHNVKEYFNCLKCHSDMPKANEYVNCIYKGDFIMLCYNCHGADAEKCHPINMPLSKGMTLPEGFALDDDGLISCVTCHNPDCSGDKKIRYRNLNAIYKSSCKECHDFSEEKIVDPHKSKDNPSEDCYYCHRKTESMEDFGMNQKFICLKCHVYKEHPQKGNIVMSEVALQTTGVKLDKKSRIKCTTCHDPHDSGVKNFKLKVIDGMTICEACHQ